MARAFLLLGLLLFRRIGRLARRNNLPATQARSTTSVRALRRISRARRSGSRRIQDCRIRHPL